MGARDAAFLALGATVVLAACLAAAALCQDGGAEPVDAVAFELPITDKSYSEMAVFGPESEVDDG